jgi:hypothetical protein
MIYNLLLCISGWTATCTELFRCADFMCSCLPQNTMQCVLMQVKRTEGVSTTDIVGRMLLVGKTNRLVASAIVDQVCFCQCQLHSDMPVMNTRSHRKILALVVLHHLLLLQHTQWKSQGMPTCGA